MKRKNSDSSHYKYDMYDRRSSKRHKGQSQAVVTRTFKSRPAIRSRTWGEYGKQVAGGTAAAGLGFIAGDFPGALLAGKKTYEYLAPDLKYDEVTQNNNIMQTYGGRFNVLPEGSGSLTAVSQRFASNGIVLNREVYGQVADPDCVYIGHNTYDPSFFAFGLACVIVRKVLRKAGYNATSINETIPMLNNTEAGPGTMFVFTYTNTDGTTGQSAAHQLTAGSTIESIVNGSNLAGTIEKFYNYTTADVVAQPFEIEYAYLRTVTEVAQAKGTLLSSIALRNEIAEIYVHSTMTIQNRSLTAGGSSSTDDNSVQPLQGYRYLFNGAIPKSKQKGNNNINVTANQGLILTRAAELSPAETYKEPPLPAQFYNIAGSSKVKLPPGQMKKGTIGHTYKGPFNSLLAKLYSRNNTSGVGAMRVAPGKCELFALEEIIQTTSVYKVACAYEKETRLCFSLTTGKTPQILMNYASLELSNLG